MDRDSEVETVLADEEWFEASNESTQRRNTSRRRRQDIDEEDRNSDSSECFDEEELFSSSGSLSSLHEFSDAENSDAVSDRNNSGPIVRNGLGRSKGNNRIHRNNTASSQVTESSMAIAESKVDVDDFGNTASRSGAVPGKIGRGRDSSPSSSWNTYRRRKVITDDDDNDNDNDDSKVDYQDGLEADVEDNSTGRNLAEPRQSKNKDVDLERHRGSVRKSQVDKALRRHKLTKRRKPRYDEPDYVDDRGCPQLVYFAGKGDTSACRKLLLRGASINMADSNGNTAAHAASKHGCVDTLELLLDPPARAQIDGISDNDEESGSSETSEKYLLRQLLSPLPNVNTTTSSSRMTPLHLAVFNDDISTVRMLLDHGASTSITNSRYLTPLETCSNEKVARLLTDRAKTQRTVLARDKAGQTKLHRACNAGDLEQTVSLLNQGADIDLKDNAKWTPLHEASLEGHSDVVLALLRRGADFNARGFGGDTPLHDACANGHVDVVRCLIAAGADPHLQNSKNETPEDMAKEEEQNDVLRVIEKHKRSDYRYSVPAVQKLSRRAQNGKGKRPEVHSDASDSDASDSAGIEADFSRIDVVSDGADPETAAHGLAPSATSSGDNRKQRPPVRAGTSRVRRSGSLQPHSFDERNGDDGHGTGNKREIASLKRLRDEAEKPKVNYYYSSSTSKLSRDERKLQVLVGTIERMEKRKSKTQRRSSLDSNISPALLKDISYGLLAASESITDRENVGVDVNHPGEAGPARNRQSSSISPQRQGGRPSKKRVIDDDDEDEERTNDEESLVAGGITVHHGVKRTKHATIDPLDASVDSLLVKKEYPQQVKEQQPKQPKQRQRGRSSVITIDGSSNPSGNKQAVRPSSLFDTPAAFPTVAIKREPVFGQTVEHQAPPKTKPAKSRLGGGRTIVEDPTVRIEHAEPRTQSSIAAQAIRYLPLYTIQLHSDPPTSKLDYFVVDLQIRLLLGMRVGTPKDDGDSDNDDSRAAESNPLFTKYPSLCRQRVTESQKERLWEPLAGMFVSNLQFIHEATASSLTKSATNGSATPPPRGSTKSAKYRANRSKAETATASTRTLDAEVGVLDADNELVSQFTLHEKRKFVALRLYFVKLDEVVRIIRRDFPQVSKQLITITLDLSSIGLADAAAVVSSHSPSTHPRPITNMVGESDPASAAPVWNGPQKMLPLRYALKLYYQNKTRQQKPSSDAS